MGYKERTLGGGPAKDLAGDFTNFLQSFINSGSFGGGTAGQQLGAADPTGNAAGIFGLLNSIISNPQADKSVQDLIAKDTERGRNDLRARFGTSGGMAFGTPAAFSEALYSAEQAPRTALAMDQMAQGRIASLMPFFEMLQNISMRGIPQAETTLQPPGWLQAVNLGLDVANTAANFIPGGGGGETNRTASSYAPRPQLTQPTIAQPTQFPIIRYPNPPITRGITAGMPGFTPMPFGNPSQQWYN